MTIRVGDQTIWLEQNYLGTGRPVLISRAANGEVQVLATFSEPHKGDSTGTVRVLRNYAFRFANSGGVELLSPLPNEATSNV